MKVLTLMILLLIATCGMWVFAASAGCITRESQPWYTNWDRFELVNRSLTLSMVGGGITMQRDIEEGAAFFIDSGTPVELLETYSGEAETCKIKAAGMILFGYRHFITCD